MLAGTRRGHGRAVFCCHIRSILLARTIGFFVMIMVAWMTIVLLVTCCRCRLFEMIEKRQNVIGKIKGKGCLHHHPRRRRRRRLFLCFVVGWGRHGGCVYTVLHVGKVGSVGNPVVYPILSYHPRGAGWVMRNGGVRQRVGRLSGWLVKASYIGIR